MTQEAIKNRLLDYFSDAHVEVYDLTGGGDHYEVLVQSNLFRGMSRIQQHQKVMAVFANELKSGEVHALSIRTQTKGVPQ